MSNFYSKQDIDYQIIKVKMVFFNSRLGHMSIPAYISIMFISLYMVLNYVLKYISCILILLTTK